MSCLLYQDNKIVGVFDDLKQAKNMAQGILDNGWAKNFHIEVYKANSCCKINEVKIDNPDESEIESDTESIIIETQSEEDENLQSKLNTLKLQKEKIEESKTKYEVDYKLYKEFKEKLETDNSFTIPELFIEKYKIFHQLDQEDNISWDSFSMLYKEPDYFGSYSNVFEISNSFETKFLKTIESDTESSEGNQSSDDKSDDSNSIIEIIQVVDSSEESDTY